MPDDHKVPGADLCGDQNCATSSPAPQTCDGTDTDNTPPFDEGCGDDEHKSGGCGQDSDGAPVRFSSGRVESNSITLFSVPTPDNIFFGFRIQWGSGVLRTMAAALVVNGVQDPVPTIHDQEETTYYFGKGWLDDFGDRLYINVKNKQPDKMTWQSRHATVTFTAASGWKSWSGKYELIDRGPNPADGFGRWVVRTTDTSAPREMWSFEEYTYTSYSTPVTTYTLGRLRRHALLTSNLTNLTGRYGFTLTWAADGTLANVVDSLTRELDFFYYSPPPDGGITRSKSLSRIQYRPASAGVATDVVTLQMTSDNQYLDRVIKSGLGGYTRFLYLRNAQTQCRHCGALMSDVIVPGDAASSTPVAQAPLMSTEIALEHNDYAPTSAGVMRGSYAKYPGREYAYQWGNQTSIQFDLHQDGGACGPSPSYSCASGYSCRTTDNNGAVISSPHCYVATIHTNDGNDLSTASYPAGGTAGGVSGSSSSFARNYTIVGAPHDATDSSGATTTYGYDTVGRLRCLVHNDNDNQAFADPTHPDTSACAGPTSGQVVRVDYTTTSITKTTASLLSTSVTEVMNLDTTLLLPTSVIRTGYTKDITGSLHSETHTSTFAYDAYGRLTSENGPLTDSVAFDNTVTTYWTSTDLNNGQIHQFTKYVGTSSSNTPITTTYSNYDAFGVPQLIINPNGDKIMFTPSSDRLIWTITQVGADGTTIGTSTVAINANGTIRSTTDADGICLTYEYSDGSGYVGAPTKIRRSARNDNCGVTPIDPNSGEVEIRAYINGERDRLQSVTRQMNGTVQFTYSGFSYDVNRRVVGGTTLDSPSSYAFGYTDVLQSSITAPGAPAAGTWKTVTTADALGRPTSLLRYVDATNTENSVYTYATTSSPRPTQLTRGYNGAATSISTFTYDDFGRLLDATVPEAGAPGSPAPTRYEYDVAGRMIKKRVGSGTSLVRTDVYSYDSLGRTTFVDHDTEHPVDCSTAPVGTPIEDEEYKYDNCTTDDIPSGFACTHALGRLTLARTILQCGSGGQTIKHGRWYDYDVAGREYRVAYATVTGSTIGPPAILDYTYTAASRVSQYRSPLDTSFGTRYTFGASDGRITGLTTSDTTATTIASGIGYQAFGPMNSLTTASVQTVGSSRRTMYHWITYRTDNAISNYVYDFLRSSGFNVPAVPVVYQYLGYSPASVISSRQDVTAGENASSRYYGYDALLRMTCEARGSSDGTLPTSTDCSSSSSRLAGLFTYGNGEGATSPPDVRKTAFLKGDGGSYVSPSTETMTYSGGSGQLQTITRTGSALTIAYDALGRRSYEYDSFDTSRSRRDYTYLPNGQLGTVSGRTSGNVAYTATVRYDERRRPVTITEYDYYELFWDDADRLIAVQITFGSCRLGGIWCLGSTNYGAALWHYHYLGDKLVAATRELHAAVDAHVDVKRFWPATDERGLIYRMVDEVGSTYWQAHWDASGWRTWVGTPQPETWVPFGLPGQVLLAQNVITTGAAGPIVWGTEASASGTGGTWTRPAIALNGQRAVDPLLGAFLQADDSDMRGRNTPEGYIQGRNNLIAYVDPDGNRSQSTLLDTPYPSYNIDSSCSDRMGLIEQAINIAAMAVANCVAGGCGGTEDTINRRWVNAIYSGNYGCVNSGQSFATTHYFKGVEYRNTYQWQLDAIGVRMDRYGQTGNTYWQSATALTNMAYGDTVYVRDTVLGPIVGQNTRYLLGPGYDEDKCLATQIAHEALHAVMNTEGGPSASLGLEDQDPIFWGTKVRGSESDEKAVIIKSTECVNKHCN
jgi:YD repeat-containing protein